MGADDQNDSLIDELADFLNGTPENKDNKMDKDNFNHIENENNISLNKAIVINENEELSTDKHIKSQNHKNPQSFIQITEKQILQSSQEINNNLNNEEV